MQSHIQADAVVTASVNGLLVELEGVGVSTLTVFADGRQGGPQHWVAYLGIDGQRYFIDTKPFDYLNLEKQAVVLLEQFNEFVRDRS